MYESDSLTSVYLSVSITSIGANMLISNHAECQSLWVAVYWHDLTLLLGDTDGMHCEEIPKIK